MSTSVDKTLGTLAEKMAATWLTYVDAWNAENQSDRKRLLSEAGVADSKYVDPNVDLQGHNSLAEYMGEFHNQMPGANFVLTRFISHHQKSIACWEVHDKSGKTLFTGVSYGTYNSEGKLTAEHGFFETSDNE